MAVAHIDVFRRDPTRFWHFYGDRFQTLEHKRPNGAHEALAKLERAGQLRAVITQNIDRLHAKAGTEELIEVHGTIDHSSCQDCGARYRLSDVRARQGSDVDGVPRCDCGLPLKPDVVLFGEYLPVDALRRAEGYRGDRRPADLHRLLARGLPGRRAARDDAGGRGEGGDRHPGSDAV